MKILAIDYGDKNIGIAITDEMGMIPIPFSVEENNEFFAEKLLKIVKEKKINKIIAGFPINLKGNEGFQAKKVKDFFNDLGKKVDIDIELIDERYSTRSSIDRLKKMNKKNIKEVDKFAAAIILENYLNRISK